MAIFKDTGHLFRFAALFVVGTTSIFVLRAIVTPKSFGQYGHYRGAALKDLADRPVKYAGHQACEVCHTDIVTTKTAGKHAGVNCEACHGPLAKHADDPSITPAKLDTAVLCVKCHAASAAKPKGFPQVQADDHSGGLACDTCHKPHDPAIAAGGAK